jgi:hypothetical protein
MTKTTFIVEGKRYDSLEAAKAAAQRIFERTGNIVAITLPRVSFKSAGAVRAK